MTSTHEWLRLSEEDLVLLRGILRNHKDQSPGHWPRVDRILFDLHVIMRKHGLRDEDMDTMTP